MEVIIQNIKKPKFWTPSIVISILALIISAIVPIQELTKKPQITFDTNKTIKFSQEYGTLTPEIFIFFNNEGNERGKIFKIKCTILPKNKKFKNEYFAKYYNDPYRKFDFMPFVIEPMSTASTDLLFYPDFDEKQQLQNVKFNELRINT